MSRDISDFIANLNSLEPYNDNSPGKSSRHDSNNNNDVDLSIFANTQFFDFDMGRPTDIAASVDDLIMAQEKQVQKQLYDIQQQEHNKSVTPQQIDFSNYQQLSIADGLTTTSPTPVFDSPTSSNSNDQSPVDIKPATKKRKFEPTRTLSTSSTTNANSTPSPASSSSTVNTTSVANQQQQQPEPERTKYIEEDKRRRNTLASARFRIKKKLREQEMERSARELQEKVQKLESQVLQLEMENRWLKNLVVEKNDARDEKSLMNLKREVLADAEFEQHSSERNL